MKVKPMGMLLMMLAGWINRHQQDVPPRRGGSARLIDSDRSQGCITLAVNAATCFARAKALPKPEPEPNRMH